MRTRFVRSTALALGMLSVLGAPVRAQDDAEGSKDHPMFPRLNGYFIGAYEMSEFDAAEFPVGEDKTETVEGKLWRIDYWLKDGARRNSELEIARNYQNAVAKAKGKAVFQDGNRVVFRFTTADSDLWVWLQPGNGGEAYNFTIVERTGMKQQVEITATELARQLAESGSVALRNILFDTGRATIQPASFPALGMVAEVLNGDPELKLEIQGHTDNVGTAASNLTLSRARAAAVRDYLVKTSGIAADRLTATGFGDTMPMADNATDDGRAQNRRVELVKR